MKPEDSVARFAVGLLISMAFAIVALIGACTGILLASL